MQQGGREGRVGGERVRGRGEEDEERTGRGEGREGVRDPLLRYIVITT